MTSVSTATAEETQQTGGHRSPHESVHADDDIQAADGPWGGFELVDADEQEIFFSLESAEDVAADIDDIGF